MLQVAIINKDDDGIYAKEEYFIKPIPRIPKRELIALGINPNSIRSASVFCDLAPLIIEKIEETQTVFSDKFSERLFVKTFKEIGYPMGSATHILDKLFKQAVGGKIPYSLKNAQKALGIKMKVSTTLEKCELIQKVFENIPEIGRSVKVAGGINKTLEDAIPHLPNTPGVYFFRNAREEVIYVGKAINISKRVRSHFSSNATFERTLCAQTTAVDYEETGSELISLLLESHYIGSLSPEYNSQQKELLQPYIITSKIDSKGILRLQPIQKNYADSENEFYYNRDSVLVKLIEVQRKFKLCKRYAGIERTKTSCSDTIYCKGICRGEEDKNDYNARVRDALNYIDGQRPSYIIKLKGRHKNEMGFVMVKQGIYCGFGYIDSDTPINSSNDIAGFLKNYAHNYFTSRIIDQFHKTNKRREDNVFKLSVLID
ncbi:GIY-YIG nuclease family protein [Aequorivita aquimaris]|uniref:GIY-YIG nuclease family protein n=1 Tax=Aequorivita aquimaris TaxID=1548749 RepID=UPI0007878AC8|nr:GIY-YIG nuclease family protein [Aequorivita aquimaris]